MSEVAVLVLNFNGRHLLQACLTSLQGLTIRARIVVVDNGSDDGSVAYVQEHFPGVQVLELGANLGFAAGYNRALAKVDSPWAVLLNNDATPEPAWLEHLLAAAAREPRAAILGGKLLFGGGNQAGGLLQSAGASFTDAGAAFEIGWGEADQGQYDQPARVGAIPGAAMLVRRSTFLELGGFDASYYAYLEDVDLCWRVWLTGHEVHYVPQAVALHRYGASWGGRASPFRIRQVQRNRLANVFKNLESASLPGAIIVSLAYDLYRVLEFTRRGQFAALQALASGSLAFLRDLRGILARRATIQRNRVISDQTLREKGLLIPAGAAFREYRRLDRLAEVQT